MKGVIFAEMIRWVEQAWSPAMADRMIEVSRIESDGAYTSVGSYPHAEALAMLGALSSLTGTPVSELADTYGYWLSGRFVELYSEMFEGYSDTVTFLKDVDSRMHREVKKLYADARTPSVIAEIDGEEVTVLYASHRPFADVAHGLIRGYIDHFDDHLVVERDLDEPGPHAARFKIRHQKAAVA